jgi:hypothetical protein
VVRPERLKIVAYIKARAETLPEPIQSAVLAIAKDVLRGMHIPPAECHDVVE